LASFKATWETSGVLRVLEVANLKKKWNYLWDRRESVYRGSCIVRYPLTLAVVVRRLRLFTLSAQTLLALITGILRAQTLRRLLKITQRLFIIYCDFDERFPSSASTTIVAYVVRSAEILNIRLPVPAVSNRKLNSKPYG